MVKLDLLLSMVILKILGSLIPCLGLMVIVVKKLQFLMIIGAVI